MLCMLFASFQACCVPPHQGVSKLKQSVSSLRKRSATSCLKLEALLRTQDEADLSIWTSSPKQKGTIFFSVSGERQTWWLPYSSWPCCFTVITKYWLPHCHDHCQWIIMWSLHYCQYHQRDHIFLVCYPSQSQHCHCCHTHRHGHCHHNINIAFAMLEWLASTEPYSHRLVVDKITNYFPNCIILFQHVHPCALAVIVCILLFYIHLYLHLILCTIDLFTLSYAIFAGSVILL